MSSEAPRASLAAELQAVASRLLEVARDLEAREGDPTNGATPADGVRLLTAREACQRTGLGRAAIYRLARAGEAGAVKVGERGVRFCESGLAAWLRQGGCS